MALKILFMGTPEYAAQYLNALILAHFKPFAVITQPDRPVGRDKHIEPTPVKKLAIEHTIEVYQPEDIRDPEWSKKIQELAPDIIVVVAFGQIIPKAILDIPILGCINVHPSLLPNYRGAAPLQAAILNGDSETGVTIMQMDERMDHGPILAQETIQIDERETIHTLREKTTSIGTKLLLAVLTNIAAGKITPYEQDHSKATYTKLLKLEDGNIDFSSESAEVIDCRIRALNPEPGTWTLLNDKRLKILEAHPVSTRKNDTEKSDHTFFTIKTDNTINLYAQCASGFLQLDIVQLEGKKQMTGAEFVRGNSKIVQ